MQIKNENFSVLCSTRITGKQQRELEKIAKKRNKKNPTIKTTRSILFRESIKNLIDKEV